MTIDREPTVSLHRRIRTDIELRIMSGELKPGDRIPFEHELMDRYSCSRMTVNKALTGLAATGLIERRRRAGSFVAPQRIDMAALAIPDMRAEIEGRGALYGLDLIARRIVRRSATQAAEIDAPIGARVLRLLCLHSADGRPFAIEHRLINLDTVSKAAEVDFGAIPPGTWLLENVPWTQAENRISAGRAGPDGSHLGIDSTFACLVLERQTWRASDAVTHVRQVFPAGVFSLTARFAAVERAS